MPRKRSSRRLGRTTDMDAIDLAPPTAGPRGAKIGLLAALGVAALVTLYLLTMTVWWGIHHHGLTSSKSDLTTSLEAEQAVVDSQSDELAGLTDELELSRGDVSQFASDNAKYQDHVVIYRHNDQALSDCADARLEVIQYVKARYIWMPGPLHAWDNEVAAYCGTSVQYFTDNVDYEESL